MLRAINMVNKVTSEGVCARFFNARLQSHSAKSEVGGKEEAPVKEQSERLKEFRKKLRETTDIEDLGEQIQSFMEDDPLPPWPDNTNPHTGEVGGPKGPEPTRYGDWERKGRVTDF